MARETINFDPASGRAFRALQPVTNGEDRSIMLNLFENGLPAQLPLRVGSDRCGSPSATARSAVSSSRSP